VSGRRAPPDTIAAIATAPGRGGIGVVRISGPDAARIGAAVAGDASLAARRPVLRTLRDARGGAIDQGLLLYFPAPGSYTGEDVVELHGHGGPVVLRLLLGACLERGARAARPGEFTERAFHNGRLDLAQAEAVADLIDAGSERAARAALRSLAGAFSAEIDALASGLTELRALVEATLDFPEEDGVDFLGESDAAARLAALRARLARVQAAARQGSLLREGLCVVLIGEPNVGKSSLLNRLAGDDIAIVTDQPGTTRDALRETIAIDGVPVQLIDTAGLRDTDDPLERLGIERTRQAIGRADCALLISVCGGEESDRDRRILGSLPSGLAVIHVRNKVDLSGAAPGRVAGAALTVRVSARTGAGVDALRALLLEVAGWDGAAGEGVYLARARHLDALRRVAGHLDAAACPGLGVEFYAEELRLAHAALGEITGAVSADDLLGEIFGRFCIGK
jgi:tRNA modification GTPase